jgi:transcriptional regulator with XRE-family HTH domain
MSIGERFREIRRGKNLKQIDFSQKIGISQSALVSYERGEREPPAAAIASFCEAYDVSPDWVLLGRGVAYREDQIAIYERAMRLAKEYLPKFVESPTIDQEVEFTTLLCRYLIENGAISKEMIEALGSRRTANE